jgi:membrane-bound lytic murein transglycosylase B
MIARRRFIELLAATPFGGWAAEASGADFAAFLQTLWPRAREKGVSRATFDAVTGGLTLDSSLPQASGSQPEFDRPLQAYFKEAVSAARIAEGRRAAVTYASSLRAGEAHFGVPGEIVLAAWAMESDFGRSRGKRDIFRSLATQAFTRPDRPLFRDEFIEALLILESGQASRAQMTGSWAGAMGDPQFLPSAYRKYAVSASGEAKAPDIWTSPPDILASIANFLKLSAWRPDRPWAKEVLLPDGFPVPALHARMAEWAAEGVRPASGAMPANGEAALFLPSGADGPAFLLFENHWVLKQYNNSDSYALSLGVLAQRIAGGPALAHTWPEHVANLSRTDKAFIQARLAALGLYDGAADGKFGPSSRDAIHAFQRRAGISPADGFATPALVQSLRAATP